MPPLIDILMPTYEPDPAFLCAAIESLLHQTETRWRMFIHDDASKTDVKAIIEPYLKDPRITFERSVVRLGIGGNWNACLTPGNAPFIAYLFQDDLWAPAYLEEMLAVMEKEPSVGFVSADHTYDCDASMGVTDLYNAVRHERQKFSSGKYNGHDIMHQWIKRELTPNIIGEPSFSMIRRSLIEQVGTFNEHMPQFLDVEYWIRCLLAADWYWVNEPLGTFRVHGKGASAQNQQSGAGIYDRLQCFEFLINHLPSGDLRSVAIHARNSALDTMMQKFFRRMKNKQSIPGKSSGGAMTFAIKHPFLVFRSLLRSMRSQKSQ